MRARHASPVLGQDTNEIVGRRFPSSEPGLHLIVGDFLQAKKNLVWCGFDTKNLPNTNRNLGLCLGLIGWGKVGTVEAIN